MSFFEKLQTQEPIPDALDSVMSASQQWEEMQRHRVPYQTSLRTIGVFLDESEACHAHVLETTDGFSIRYQHQMHGMTLFTHHVAYADVLSLTAQVDRRRKRRPFGFGQRLEHRYENTLRALGHELDAAQAYSLLVDEVDEGFLVTYQYLNPTEGSMVRKRMVFLDLGAIEQVLGDAYARRHDGKRGLLTLLAG